MKFTAKYPVSRDRLTIAVRIGMIARVQVANSLAGMGSKEHDFDSELLINSVICLFVSGVNYDREDVAGGSGKRTSRLVEYDRLGRVSWIFTIFSAKKVAR